MPYLPYSVFHNVVTWALLIMNHSAPLHSIFDFVAWGRNISSYLHEPGSLALYNCVTHYSDTLRRILFFVKSEISTMPYAYNLFVSSLFGIKPGSYS